MPAHDPDERYAIALSGGLAYRAKMSPAQIAAGTARARAGQRQKIADRIDPQRHLPAGELERRVTAALREHMAAISRRGVEARAAKRAAAA
jgi:hypothetical protein